jgi:hypothetical protein
LDNSNWTVCKLIISNAAEEVIKEEDRRKRSKWFDKECEETTVKKNLVCKEMIQRHYTRKAVENYNKLGEKRKNYIRRIKGYFRKKF